MPDEAAFNEAMGVFNDLRREVVFVETSGEWVIFEFEGADRRSYEFHVNLWNGIVVLEDTDRELDDRRILRVR